MSDLFAQLAPAPRPPRAMPPAAADLPAPPPAGSAAAHYQAPEHRHALPPAILCSSLAAWAAAAAPGEWVVYARGELQAMPRLARWGALTPREVRMLEQAAAATALEAAGALRLSSWRQAGGFDYCATRTAAPVPA